MVLQENLKGVSRKFHGCFKELQRVFQGCFKSVYISFKCELRKFRGNLKDILMGTQGYIKKFNKWFNSFKGVSRNFWMFQDSFKGI